MYLNLSGLLQDKNTSQLDYLSYRKTKPINFSYMEEAVIEEAPRVFSVL